MLSRRHALTLLAAVAAPSSSAEAQTTPVLVFAAASLKTALDAIMAQWRAETGRAVAASYAASSALARQIAQGAPAHLLISADLEWMDYVADKGAIRKETRVNLLGNALVLVGKPGAPSIEIKPGFDLASRLDGGRLAVGEVSSVPAGRYAKAALQSLGAWQSVESKLAQAENVRAALLLVARGEAPLGIVYRSDAVAEKAVEIQGAFPADSHPPIVYPAALTTLAHDDAARFLGHIRSAKACRGVPHPGLRRSVTGQSEWAGTR